MPCMRACEQVQLWPGDGSGSGEPSVSVAGHLRGLVAASTNGETLGLPGVRRT